MQLIIVKLLQNNCVKIPYVDSLIRVNSDITEYTSFSSEINTVLNNSKFLSDDKLNEIYKQLVTEFKLNKFKVENEELTIPINSFSKSKYNVYNNKSVLDTLNYLLELLSLVRVVDETINETINETNADIRSNSISLEYIYDLHHQISLHVRIFLN